jgi:riboflavin synthase
MFTGLIEAVGRVVELSPRGRETRIGIEWPAPAPAFAGGESIAVNGACLTVESFSGAVFSVYASAETMRVTSLGGLRAGSPVNLERALAMGDRLGGHMVSGHVDCLAEVVSVDAAGESRIYRLSFPAEHGGYVVPKGSVALDGVSLTVNECGQDWLTVNIIPETQKKTNVSKWSAGAAVNMETDLIGKYVARMLSPWLDSRGGDRKAPITEDFLKKHGF